jgi:hypothetical protein
MNIATLLRGRAPDADEVREPDEVIEAQALTDEQRDRLAAEVRAQTAAMAATA